MSIALKSYTIGIWLYYEDAHVQDELIYYVFKYCCAVLSCSVMSDSVTPWTIAHQAPLPMGFSRQVYWSG